LKLIPPEEKKFNSQNLANISSQNLAKNFFAKVFGRNGASENRHLAAGDRRKGVDRRGHHLAAGSRNIVHGRGAVDYRLRLGDDLGVSRGIGRSGLELIL
jgi:hypothetical protein